MATKSLADRVAILETNIGTLRKDVSALQQDMVIVREGINLLLKGRRQ